MARAVVSQGSGMMIYAFETYELDLCRHELRCAGAVVAMEPRVFQALTYVVQHRDHAIAKAELLAHLWPGQYVQEWVLVQSVVKARRAIGDTGRTQRCIKTITGYGYRFIAPVEECTAVTPAAQASVPSALQPIASRRVGARQREAQQAEDVLVVYALSVPERGQVCTLLQEVFGWDKGGQGGVVLLCAASTCLTRGVRSTSATVSTLPCRRSRSATVPGAALTDADTASTPPLESPALPRRPVVSGA